MGGTRGITLLTFDYNAEQFLRATKAAVHGQKKADLVTPLQIDILFALFDDNGPYHNQSVIMRYASLTY